MALRVPWFFYSQKCAMFFVGQSKFISVSFILPSTGFNFETFSDTFATGFFEHFFTVANLSKACKLV